MFTISNMKIAPHETKILTKRLYSPAEVAEITGWSLGTVRQYISRGGIPSVHLGRKRMVAATVLEQICAEGIKFEWTKKKAGRPRKTFTVADCAGDPFAVFK